MKKIKKLVSLLIVASMSLSMVACSSGNKDGGSNENPTESNGEQSSASGDKNITIAVNAEIISLDPHNTSDTLSNSAYSTMYESMYEYQQDMTLAPVLATGHQVSDDGLVYTFNLKEGIKFHDGTDFNAAAVKYNFDRVMDEVKNLRARRNTLYIEKVETPDDYTVVITLTEPFAPAMNRIATLPIISPDALEKHGDTGIITNPCGTGPYIYDEWVQGDKFVVKTNQEYWGEKPGVDSVTFKPVTENGARISMLQTGEADLIYPMPTEQVSAISGDKNIEIIEGTSTIARFAFINMSKEMFSDVRVRQAMNYAIDKEAYAKVVKSGYAEPLTSHVPTSIEYHSAQPEYEYNLEKAKELMAEAGYPDGFKCHIWAPNDTENMKGMEFISQQLAEIGIDVEVVPMEEGTLSDSIYGAQTPEESTVNMWYVSWSAFDMDGATARLFSSDSIPPVAPNVSYYMKPEADALIKAGATTVDETKRAEIYADLQEMIWNDAPWIFLGSDVLLSAKRTTTEGVFVDPSGEIVVKKASTSK